VAWKHIIKREAERRGAVVADSETLEDEESEARMRWKKYVTTRPRS